VIAEDVREYLLAWDPAHWFDTAIDIDRERETRDTIADFLAAHPEGLDRSCRDGHVTASAFVVDVWSRRAAIVHHGLAGRWLQPGGHLEVGDVDVAAAAAREAVEETGLVVAIDPRPLRLDIHPVKCRLADGSKGPSTHFDIGLLALTLPGAPTRPASDPVAWWPLDGPEVGDLTMKRLRHAALRRIDQK
jgi:8-oxo-dGTP pyrophosphatase MutT (NUDIX family)